MTTTDFVTYFSWQKIDWGELAYATKDRDREEIIAAAMTPICGCGHCAPHKSDCAVHDSERPAPCDCR